MDVDFCCWVGSGFDRGMRKRSKKSKFQTLSKSC